MSTGAFGAAVLLFSSAASVAAETRYDLLLRGGHVVDPKSETSAVRDVAIADGRIAAVAEQIDPAPKGYRTTGVPRWDAYSRR